MKFPFRPALWSLFGLCGFVSLGLLACGGGGGSDGSGTLRVSLTDAPACGYEHVWVTVEKVRVHQSSSAGDGDGGWSEIALTPPRRIDLRTLTNGVLEELGQTALPAGTYQQMRLVLAANGSAAPFANAVVPDGSVDEVPLETPSGQQTGLKMNIDLPVAANKVADFVVDFDACKSVVARGHSGQYNLKPVLSGTVVLSDAGMRVVGWVDPSIAAAAHVSVQQAGTVEKSTIPDPATGRFVLYPVAVGNYDLVVTADARVTAVMTGVPVTDTAITTVNSTTLAINPGPTTMRGVAGTVAPASAEVRATQSLSGGTTIEVARAAVNAGTGEYAMNLPIGAAVKVPYAPNPTVLNFTAEAANGLYTVEAGSGGATKTTPIDAKSAVGPVNFSFP